MPNVTNRAPLINNEELYCFYFHLICFVNNLIFHDIIFHASSLAIAAFQMILLLFPIVILVYMQLQIHDYAYNFHYYNIKTVFKIFIGRIIKLSIRCPFQIFNGHQNNLLHHFNIIFLSFMTLSIIWLIIL